MSDEGSMATGGGASATAPLNLPVGSVRALLTLAVLGTVWAQILFDGQPSEELRDTMLLILGYYFGKRSAKHAAAEAFTEAGDREENPADPLYLPRGAIRLLIVVGFAAVAWKLYEKGTLLTTPPPILILVGMFLAGAMVKGTAVWIGKRFSGKAISGVAHMVAAATLLVVLGFCAVDLLGLRARAPEWLTPTFLAVIGFYLGKR